MIYEVERSIKFDRKVKALMSSYSRMTDFDAAIDWYLSRCPEEYPLGKNYYLWVTSQLPVKNIPAVKIIYRINHKKKKVILIDIC